jgi:hypothetical protein
MTAEGVHSPRRGRPARGRLPRLTLRLGAPILGRVKTTAKATGRTVAEVGRELMTEALDAREEGRQWTHFRADDVVENQQRMEALFNRLAPGILGILRLLAHWAARTGQLRVDEDELLAEVRAVGQDEWKQILEELTEPPLEASEGGVESPGEPVE